MPGPASARVGPDRKSGPVDHGLRPATRHQTPDTRHQGGRSAGVRADSAAPGQARRSTAGPIGALQPGPVQRGAAPGRRARPDGTGCHGAASGHRPAAGDWNACPGAGWPPGDAPMPWDRRCTARQDNGSPQRDHGPGPQPDSSPGRHRSSAVRPPPGSGQVPCVRAAGPGRHRAPGRGPQIPAHRTPPPGLPLSDHVSSRRGLAGIRTSRPTRPAAWRECACSDNLRSPSAGVGARQARIESLRQAGGRAAASPSCRAAVFADGCRQPARSRDHPPCAIGNQTARANRVRMSTGGVMTMPMRKY